MNPILKEEYHYRPISGIDMRLEQVGWALESKIEHSSKVGIS